MRVSKSPDFLFAIHHGLWDILGFSSPMSIGGRSRCAQLAAKAKDFSLGGTILSKNLMIGWEEFVSHIAISV